MASPDPFSVWAKFVWAVLGAVADADPAGLEVLEIAARRNFKVALLGRQPSLDVIRLRRAETEVPSAQSHHPVRDFQTLEDFLGIRREAL